MINKTGIYTAVLTFLISTVLLIIYYFTNSPVIILIAPIFIAIAAILNIGILFLLVIRVVNRKNKRKKHLKTSGLMLLNISIALLYFKFAMFLINHMVITLVNNTGETLTDIKIIGGETKTIDRLGIGKKDIEWIYIVKDNSLSLEYKIDNEVRKEKVHGYTIGYSGKRIKYSIEKK
ncbi:hypothetical protein OOZ15_00850 [Galbibacter sp. EGI 63066]|uniref:hypothetical protein n=1 Tax=Galbibacter sp. EGI 63066 TaxID=2993559 RepID=UPI00224891E1|nr:hypothetical protein [Galbibacter sp. EGI 63066]MCX2678477.1 hypothetical protein [Galbibacter sp. EGI 63066]